MLRLDSGHFSQKFVYSMWLLMSFQAGYINVGGLSIFSNFVSHVTGTSSQVGIGLAKGDWSQLVTFLSILVAFIAGAAFSGHYIGRKIEEGKKPDYILVTTVKAVLFGIVLFMSEMHFSSPQAYGYFSIILLLSICCGIQNATCSQATQGFLKPTHMTGLSTEIGIHLSKIFSWRKDETKFNSELRKNHLRIGILLSFIFGGSIAALIFNNNGHYGFLFPFISSLCFLAVSILSEPRFDKKEKAFLNIAKTSIWGTTLTTISLALYLLIK